MWKKKKKRKIDFKRSNPNERLLDLDVELIRLRWNLYPKTYLCWKSPYLITLIVFLDYFRLIYIKVDSLKKLEQYMNR